MQLNSRPDRFSTREASSYAHWMGGWVVPDLVLSERTEKKVSLLLGIKLKPTACPCPVPVLAPYCVMYFPRS
jgi:hypothetical protein